MGRKQTESKTAALIRRRCQAVGRMNGSSVQDVKLWPNESRDNHMSGAKMGKRQTYMAGKM